MSTETVSPKHLIVDQGPEFKCEHFENVSCEAKNIQPRFGAVAKSRSMGWLTPKVQGESRDRADNP